MNLLNNIFSYDNMEINKVNKRYILIFSLLIILILLLMIIKKDNYYENTFTVIDNSIVLLVDKNYVNKIKDNKKIIIDNIDCEYSINSVEPLNDMYMVNIKIDIKINVNNGSYKLYLGKERIFDYIVRIIKKWK